MATGWVNGEPLSTCPYYKYDTDRGSVTINPVPCHVLRTFLLTPTGR